MSLYLRKNDDHDGNHRRYIKVVVDISVSVTQYVNYTYLVSRDPRVLGRTGVDVGMCIGELKTSTL